AIETALKTCAPVHGLIAHSFGGTSAALLLGAKPSLCPQHLVLIGAPSSLEFLTKQFSVMVGLRPDALAKLRERIEAMFGRSLDSFNLENYVPHFLNPGLVVHDQRDEVVP